MRRTVQGDDPHAAENDSASRPCVGSRSARLLEALDGVDEVVQTQRAHAGHLRVRIEESERDQVEALVARAPREKRPRILDARVHAARRVRSFGMQRAAQRLDGRIDLDCGHARRAVSKRGRDVVAGARSDHEDAAGLDDPVRNLVRERPVLVERLLLRDERRRQIEQILVVVVVHVERAARGERRRRSRSDDRDLVVGRPPRLVALIEPLRAGRDERHRRERHDGRSRSPAAPSDRGQRHRPRGDPDERRRSESARDRERSQPDEARRDVQRVGGNRPRVREEPREPLAERDEDQNEQREDAADDAVEPERHARRRERLVPRELLEERRGLHDPKRRGGIQHDHAHEDGERRERSNRPRRRRLLREQADAEPEKRRHEPEVLVVGEDADLGRDPADEADLPEQDEPAHDEELDGAAASRPHRPGVEPEQDRRTLRALGHAGFPRNPAREDVSTRRRSSGHSRRPKTPIPGAPSGTVGS